MTHDGVASPVSMRLKEGHALLNLAWTCKVAIPLAVYAVAGPAILVNGPAILVKRTAIPIKRTAILINGNPGSLVCVLDCPERRFNERSPGSCSLHGSVGSSLTPGPP